MREMNVARISLQIAQNEYFPLYKLRENKGPLIYIYRGKYWGPSSLFMARPYMGFLLLLWDEADEDGAATADGVAEKCRAGVRGKNPGI